MNKALLFLSIFVFLGAHSLFSQEFGTPTKKMGGFNTPNKQQNDSLNNFGSTSVTLSGKTTYTDYKRFSHTNDKIGRAHV